MILVHSVVIFSQAFPAQCFSCYYCYDCHYFLLFRRWKIIFFYQTSLWFSLRSMLFWLLLSLFLINISHYFEDGNFLLPWKLQKNDLIISVSVVIFSPAFPAWCFSCSGPDQYYCLSVHLCTSSPWRCHDEDIQLVNALKGTKIEIHTEGRLMQMAQTWSWGCLSVQYQTRLHSNEPFSFNISSYPLNVPKLSKIKLIQKAFQFQNLYNTKSC